MSPRTINRKSRVLRKFLYWSFPLPFVILAITAAPPKEARADTSAPSAPEATLAPGEVPLVPEIPHLGIKIEESKESKESKEAAKDSAKESKAAKAESIDEVRLSMLNQLHKKELDKQKNSAPGDIKLADRSGGPVLEVQVPRDPDTPQAMAKGVCGTLQDFLGKVEILDSSRSRILDSNINTIFPCGAWISVRAGWAQIKFRDGQRVRLGHETLAQIQSEQDQMVLYRGSTYVEAGGGSGEFRLSTAIGRARLKRGKMVFLYNPESDTTQLIVLENSATLENRFEIQRRVEIQAGESSELNFKQLRVIPLLPSSVATASLKTVLEQLAVSENDQLRALRVATVRQEKKFAILRKEDIPDRSDDSGSEESLGGGRGLASVATAKKKAHEKLALTSQPYRRHRVDPDYPKLEAKMISRITGGLPSARKLTHPGSHGQASRGLASQKAQAEPEAVTSQHLLPAEEVAKKRLIHVLSEMRIE